jgi:hypothetical protein
VTITVDLAGYSVGKINMQWQGINYFTYN